MNSSKYSIEGSGKGPSTYFVNGKLSLKSRCLFCRMQHVGQWIWAATQAAETFKLWSKLLVSPLITPIVVPYVIPYII